MFTTDLRNPSYLTMRKHVIDKYRKNKKSKSLIPTFRYKKSFFFQKKISKNILFTRESFDFILAELEKREAGSDKLLIDGHFMPYSRY